MLAVSWRAPIARTSPASDAGGMRRDCTSKYNRRLVIHLLALLGVLSISFSAIFVRLAAVSPVTATFYRGAYAAPVLLVDLARADGRSDRRGRRERWLAVVSGLLLALDLNLWHESIALLGAGLGTVIANAQVVFVAAAAWALYGERPTPGRVADDRRRARRRRADVGAGAPRRLRRAAGRRRDRRPARGRGLRGVHPRCTATRTARPGRVPGRCSIRRWA